MMTFSLAAALSVFAAIALCAEGQPRSRASIAATPLLPSEPTESDAAVRKVLPVSADSIQPFSVAEDGTWFLALRFAHPDASAMRLRIQDLNLPEGAKLFIYGLHGGAITDVVGPWTGSGPIPESTFWTPAVTGSEAVVEVQVEGDTLSDLPFTVLETSSADAAEARTAAREPELARSMFRGAALTHSVQDGLAVFEGDILLGRADELPAATSKDAASGKTSVSLSDPGYRWPGGTIPYVIDPSIPTQMRVTNAIAHWNTVMAGVVRLVPRTTQGNYVYFWRSPYATRCYSYVGMIGSGQTVQVGDSCPTGNVIHEIGHAFGLWHEHSREDRDGFVKVLWSNILSTQVSNFYQNISNGTDIGAYDFASIMHYPVYAFSANGQPTIQTIPAGIPIGQRNGLSPGDIAGVKRLYPSTTTTATTSVTVTTNPSGLPVVVDSVQYTSPRTFTWAVGSAHTLAASQPVPANGTRYSFVRWSDSGSATHTITAQSSVTMYRADYSVAYSVKVSATSGGTHTVSPVSGDTYYNANTTLSLNASAYSGYCFTGWSGLIAGTPPQTSLKVGHAYTITAGFQVGSVTVNTTSISEPAAGGSVGLGVTATYGCRWFAKSQVPWARVTANATGTSSAVMTVTIDANTTGAVRYGYISVGSSRALITQYP